METHNAPKSSEKTDRRYQNGIKRVRQLKSRMKVKNDGQLSFECYVCKTALESFEKAAAHIKRHIIQEKCIVCWKKLDGVEIDQHLCASDEQFISCEYCELKFISTKHLLDHLNSHNDLITMYKCPDCPRFLGMDALMRYHQRYHEENAKIFLCPKCAKAFNLAKKLEKHMKTHMNGLCTY